MAFGPVQAGVVDGDLAFTRFDAGSGRPGGPCGPCLRASATRVGRGRGGGGGRSSPCGGGCGKGRGGGRGEGRGGHCGGERGGGRGGDRGGERGVTARAARAAEAGRDDGDGQRTSTPPSSCHPQDWWWAWMCSSNCNCTEKPAEHCCSGHTNRGAAAAGAGPPGSCGRASHMHSPAAQGAAAQGDYSTRGQPKARGSRKHKKPNNTGRGRRRDT